VTLGENIAEVSKNGRRQNERLNALINTGRAAHKRRRAMENLEILKPSNTRSTLLRNARLVLPERTAEDRQFAHSR